MKKRYGKLAVLVFFLFPILTGCWNMRELEHMFYAHAVGIDYKDGQYKLYVQILDFSTLGKKESGGAKGNSAGAWVGKGMGNSIQSALHQLYATSQRRIYWGHLTSVVVSEAVMKLGIHDILDLLTRYNELRYTLWVFGTRDPIEEVMLASPILESTPVYSQLGDPYDVYNQSSFIPPKRLYRLIVEMREPGKTPRLPMITLSKGQWTDKKEKYSALKIEGVGLLKAGKWNGWLSKEEVRGTRWLEGRAERIPLIIDSKKQPVAAIIFENPKHRITPEIRNGKVYFRIKLTVKGSVGEVDKEVSEPFLKSRSEKLIQEEIRRTFMQGLKHKADILNLSDSLYRKRPQEWRRIAKSREFPLQAESLQSIDVNVRIKNSGRTVGSFPQNGDHRR